MEPIRLPDIEIEAPELEVPDPPPDLPYERFEDYRAAELLRATNVGPDPAGVLEGLRNLSGGLLAAAAHTAGDLGLGEAAPELERLAAGPDDEVAVAAAYALTRLGAESGPAALRRLAAGGGPLDLGRLKAAGYLARLGDHRGRQIVADGLTSAYRPIRMTACKQLYFFGRDALDLFRTALGDPDDDVRWQALVQLRLLREPATRPLLEEYAARDGDGLAATARRILGEWPADATEPGPE